MKLQANILKKYLDRIMNGSKRIEIRQIESILLTDETGRRVK